MISPKADGRLYHVASSEPRRASGFDLLLRTLAFLGCSISSTPRSRQSNVFARRKAAYGDSSDHLAIFPYRQATAPSHELGIAVIGDIVALFRMTYFLSDIFRRLSLPRRGPGLVGGDAIEDTGAPSMRAKAINSPCGSATAMTAAFRICRAFSTIRSMIFLASEVVQALCGPHE